MNAVRVRVSRLLAALLLLLPLSVQAAESLSGEALRQRLDAIFATEKSTEELLQLALKSGDTTTDTNLSNNIKARAYDRLAKQAELPEEAAKIAPHVSAFLNTYDSPASSDWLRSRLARLLLKFEAAKQRYADFILDLLKESDLVQPYPKWRLARETEAIRHLEQLRGLPESQSSQAVIRLAPLLHESFSHAPRVIEAALNVADGYGARRTAAETDALVQAYGKLQKVWQQQRESEAQSASSLTVWDNATEAEVAATLQKFAASICGAKGNSIPHNYVYVPDGNQMNATGKPVTIACTAGQEAK